MDKILIERVNESFIQVDAPRHIRHELYDHFSFFAPNYRFDPRFKAKAWDGQIHNYKISERLLYHGLKDEVLRFAENVGYEVDDRTGILDREFSMKEAADFVRSLNLPSSIELRDYQIKYFVKAIRKHRLTILSPTASGKSFTIYLLLRMYQRLKLGRGLIIVPTTALVEQMYADFNDYAVEDDWSSEEFCHRVYGTRQKLASKLCTITTWQSLQNMPDDFFSRFKWVIGDEAHGFKALELIRIMTLLVNAGERISLTGSMDGFDSSKSTITGLFGPPVQIVTTYELQQQGKLSPLTIKCLILRYDKEACLQLYAAKYPVEYNYIVNNEARNQFIANLALSLEGNTLVLFRLKEEHGKILFDLIRSKAPEGRNVYYIDGNSPTDYREEVRKTLENESGSIVVASGGVFSTGTNIRNLHNAIFASFTKARVKTIQSIGRLLRTHSSKTEATLFDIVDDLSYNSKSNYAVKHYLKRREIYSQQRLKVKVYNIKLETRR